MPYRSCKFCPVLCT
uniref:Uncharacterized protein n=1 Tax=Arundo donax TaxID=35708 RepID=A0A0A9BQ25_ARUDO